MVTYLANTIRTQIDLSNRLATAALTLGSAGDALNASSGGAGGTGDGDRDRREGGAHKGGGDRRGKGKTVRNE